MKTEHKVKTEKSPSKVKAVKRSGGTVPKTNGKHPLATYEHIPVGIVESSLDGRYMDVNEEFCRILGYSRRELLRRGIKDCTHEDDYAVDYRLYEQLIASKIPYYRLEKRYIRKDGSSIWVELTRSLVYDAKRKPLYTVGVVLDISDRKDVERVLRDSVERLRLATGAAQMFMWEWDFQTQSYTVADNFEQVLGFSGGLLPRNQFETIWSLSPEADVKHISEEFTRAVENQSDLRSLPIRVINPENGQVVWLEVSAKIVYTHEGVPQRMFGVAQNITESQAAEAALQKSEHQLRLVTDAMPALISYIDSEYRYRFVNRAYSQWFGYESEDVLGKTAAEVLGEAAFEKLRPHMEAALAGNVETFETETPYQRGGTRFIRATYTPDIASDGAVNGLFVLVLDITERKQSEEALAEYARRQEALYLLSDQLHRTDSLENVYNAALEAILNALQCDRASILVYDNADVMRFVAWRGLSDAYRKATDGHSPWTPDAKNPQPISMDDVRTAELTESLRKVIQEEGIGSLAFIPLVSNGKLIGKFMVYFNAPHAFDEGELDLSLTIAHQLAAGIDRKHAEEKLRAKEAELEAIISKTPFMLTRCSRDLRYRFVSQAYAEMIGRSPEEVAGKPIVEIMGEEGLKTILPHVQAVLEGNQVEYESELNFPGVGSSFLHVVYTPDWDEQGNVIGWFASIVDISERKRAEDALARERELLERLFETMPVMVSMIDPVSNSMRLNAEFERRIGWKSEEVTVLSLLEALYPDPEYRQSVLQRMAEVDKNEWVEVQVRMRDGHIMDSLWSNISIMEDQKLIQGIAIGLDITERKQTEKRLVLLTEISDMLRNVDDPHELMYRISEAVGEHLHVKRVLFNEIDVEHDREIVHRDYHNGMESVAGVHKVTDYSSVTSAEVAAGRTVVNIDSKLDPRTAQDYEKTYAVSGERAYVVVPLMRDNRWVASLWVSDDVPRQWTSEEISLLETIAERTWAIVEKLRINTALRESEQRYRFIVENTSDGIWWVELTEPMPISLSEEEQIDWYYKHAVMRQCNLGLARMYGYNSVEDVAGLPMRILMPREIPANLELSRQFIRSNYRLVDAESRETGRDGRELIFLNNMVGIIENDKLVGEWGTNRDITARKRAEEALRRNEQMFSTLVDAAPFGVYFIDSEFRLQSINKGAEAVFSGIDPLIGRDFAEIMRIIWHEPFATEAIERFRYTLRTGESFISPQIVEERANIDEIEAYDWQIHRITLPDGTYGVVCYFYDLSEQKKMEASVRASETLYRAIASNIPGGGVYVVDKDFRYLIAEGPVTEAFGLSREMLEGHTVMEVFPDERGKRMEDRLRQNFAGERLDFETNHNGRVYWTQQGPLYDSIGQAIILTLDITERKYAEDALRQSEERFARFMQQLPGLAWIKDVDGRYVYANAAAEKAFNTPREKLYGRTDEDIFPPEVAAQFRENDQQALTDERGVQVIEALKHDDSVLHHSLVSKFPIPGPDGRTTLIGGTAFDITERLQAEEALRESEERFRAILRQATAGIVRKDAKGRLLFVNEAFCNMLGSTEPELIGKTIWEFMHPDDVEENRRSYERLMQEGIPFKLERRFLRQDGTMIWVDASVSPIIDSTGKPQSAVAVEVDITGRKLAEDALQQLNAQLEERVLNRTAKLRDVNQTLREEIAERQRVEEALRQSEAVARANEEKISTLFELLPVGISFLDPEGQIIQVNPALANMMKLSREQLSDQTYRSRRYIRANGTTMPPAEYASRRALTEGKTVYNMETGVILEDGEVIWTSVSAAPVDVAEVGAVVVTADITESKRAERALQESRERLQILSQRLVEVQEDERRSIARELHDRVGQTLAALNINLIIISGQLAGKVDEQTSTRLNDSMKLVAETIALVRDVMSNLRPSVLDDYGLEAAIESHLAQFKSRYEISVKFGKPAQPIPRLGPSVEMTFLRIAQEALMNIARHAQATQVHLALWQEEHTICMTVQDNGTGISSWEDANRPGSHGLTIMRERAEAFGGNLKVSSVPGKGTKVEVKIPIETNDPSQSLEGKLE